MRVVYGLIIIRMCFSPRPAVATSTGVPSMKLACSATTGRHRPTEATSVAICGCIRATGTGKAAIALMGSPCARSSKNKFKFRVMGTGSWVRLMRISGTCLFDSSKNTEEGKRIKKYRMVMMKKR